MPTRPRWWSVSSRSRNWRMWPPTSRYKACAPSWWWIGIPRHVLGSRPPASTRPYMTPMASGKSPLSSRSSINITSCLKCSHPSSKVLATCAIFLFGRVWDRRLPPADWSRAARQQPLLPFPRRRLSRVLLRRWAPTPPAQRLRAVHWGGAIASASIFPTGGQVPLGAFTRMETVAVPITVNHQGQFPVITLSFNLAPNASLGDAVDAVNKVKDELHMPQSIQAGFQGTAQAFQASLANEWVLILAALVTVYIVLGVLYESYIHPITILSTLPSAGVGALLALNVSD